MPPFYGPEALCFRVVRPSVCPVRPKPDIPSFHLYGTWVHWSIRPTVTVFRPVRPSVTPSFRRGFRAFPGERMEGMAWNYACWCILTTFRTDKIVVTVCWFSSIWHAFNLVKRVKFGVSGHFPENAWRECPEFFSWCILTTFIANFCAILT